MVLKDWKKTATFGKNKSVTDQWTKGDSLVDLRKSNNGFTLETFDIPKARDNIRERFGTRSQGLRRAREIMSRN